MSITAAQSDPMTAITAAATALGTLAAEPGYGTIAIQNKRTDAESLLVAKLVDKIPQVTPEPTA